MIKSKFLRKKFILIIALAIVITAGTVAFLFHTDLQEKIAIDTNTDTNTGPQELTCIVCSTVRGMSLEDVISESSLIVHGKVTGRSDAFQIVPAHLENSESDLGPMNYTDVYFEPIQVLRGETSQNQLSIRILGGTAGGVTYIEDDGPQLADGSEYILFLYQPQMGGAYNTAGNYYYICGSFQGVFEKSGENYVSKEEESFTLDELTSMLQRMRSSAPIDYEKSKNDFQNNMRLNLESGFITQEEYDRWMAESEIYATIAE